MKLDLSQASPVKKEVFSWKRELFSWVEMVIAALLFVAAVNTFIGRLVPVDGSSMEPTLHDQDRIITTSLHGDYQHNDVIVIRRKDDTPLVKRVIALAGETVDIDFTAGEVYVNDKLLDEPFIKEPTHNRLTFNGPVTVPEGHVFVMGDNRNESDDSRNSKIGMIDERNIYGKVIFRVFPLASMGKIE